MSRLTRVVTLVVLPLMLPAASARAQDPQPPQERPIVKEFQLRGATVFARDEVVRRLRIEVGKPLPDDLPALSRELAQMYRDEGYTFARAEAKLDEASGVLQFDVEEGRIDEIEFEGVSPDLAKRMVDAFTVRPGDLFNRRTVRRAIVRVLEPTGGALILARRGDLIVFRDEGERAAGRRLGGQIGRIDPFELVDRSGKRVLVVHLQKRHGAFSVGVGTEGREDWYNPVDGFSPSLRFGAMAYDPSRFNHTFIGGHVSYKFGPGRVGYSFGVERSIITEPRITIGFDVHEVTASDDFWRLSNVEQSLASFGYERTFRDYYRRRGVQIHGSVSPADGHEVVVAWRRDRHIPLANTTGYSLFGDKDQVFRANPAIDERRVGEVLLRYTWDSRFSSRERLSTAHNRHLMDDLFGGPGGQDPGWRIDWTSEFASESFGGDLNFRRHILNARSYLALSPLQRLHIRLVLGLTDGATLPPERTFAIGGIGSVRGYAFKEAAGDKMALFNAEYMLRATPRGFGVSAFFDAGRVYPDPIDGRSPWLKGVGLGLLFPGDARVEFAWKLHDIPDSLQVLVRLSPTF